MSGSFPQGTGARPPAEHAWQIGKTAATIKFVKDAEQYLATLPVAKLAFDAEIETERRHDALRAQVTALKSGEVLLSYWTSVEQFFEGLPDIVV